MTSSAIFFILVGPAGSGKTTIREHLVDRFAGTLKKCVTATSRQPRPGEVEGTSYFFLSRATFEERVAQGEFVEWQETHGNLYGTLKNTLEEARTSGQDLVFDIDIRGALFFREHYPENAVVVYLVPPTVGLLVERLTARGGSEEERRVRLRTAEREFGLFHANQAAMDYLVVNDRLPETLAHVEAIVQAERVRCSRYPAVRRAELCPLEPLGSSVCDDAECRTFGLLSVTPEG